jgi:choline dehydrogenase
MKRDNLEVVTGASVTRIRFEGVRAIGVEYARRGHTEFARAERETVLCAGAYGSPQILLLSGVGPSADLNHHGIDTVVDSPNVGRHLQEHPLAAFCWRANDANTLDDAAAPANLLRWLGTRSGKLSSNVVEAGYHWRSDSSLPAADFQFLFAPAYFWAHGSRTLATPALTLGLSYIGPHSRGSVSLRSADPSDQPRILNNMLSHDLEVDAYVRAIEHVREIAASQPLKQSLREEINPGTELKSREQVVAWLRATCEHTYHASCTCRIGSPQDGVLDSELRVHGIDGLRVADASAMPRVTSGNTQAPTLMIAERCAELMLA